MVNIISFQVLQPTSGARIVTPLIDGQSLCDKVAAFETVRGYTDPAGGYGGLIPERMNYGPLSDYFLGRGTSVARDADGAQYLLGCACGEAGCWPLMGTITAQETCYTWSAFHNPFRPARDYTALGPFVFERLGYEAAVLAFESL
jgi:hypothetical protein